MSRARREAAPPLVVVLSSRGEVVDQDDAARELLGGLETLGERDADPPRGLGSKSRDDVLRGAPPAHVRLEHVAPDGTRRTVEWSLTRMPKSGQIVATGVLVEGGASPARAERVTWTDEHVRLLLDAMPDPVFFKDGAGRWLQVNHAALEAFGLEGVDYRGKTDAELAEGSEFFREPLLYCIGTDAQAWERGPIRAEEVLARPDGSERVYDTYKVPLFHADGRRRALVVLGRDVTDRRRAELALEASEQQLRRILENTLDGIFLVDASARVTFVNPAGERLLGRAAADVIGERWAQQPLRLLRPDGTPVEDVDVLAELSRGATLRGVDVAIARPDGSHAVATLSAAPVDDRGTLVISAQDVTERAELIAIKTSFVRTAAHELRTPLTPLRLRVQQLRAQLRKGVPPDEATLAGALERMEASTDRLALLVDRLVDFVRLERRAAMSPREIVDARTLVEKVVGEFRAEVPGRTIELSASGESAQVECEAARIEQVVADLLDNALKYTAEDVAVEVDVEPEEIRITVADHGPGVPSDAQAAIFGRFFRTGDATLRHGGLGLGLALAREIAVQHGGELGFESRDGGGSRFFLKLPRAA